MIIVGGGIIGWQYDKSIADKVTDWVMAVAGRVRGWFGTGAVTFRTPTIPLPPPTPTRVNEIGGWDCTRNQWKTLKYGVSSTAYDTYGGVSNRRSDSQLEGIR